MIFRAGIVMGIFCDVGTVIWVSTLHVTCVIFLSFVSSTFAQTYFVSSKFVQAYNVEEPP